MRAQVTAFLIVAAAATAAHADAKGKKKAAAAEQPAAPKMDPAMAAIMAAWQKAAAVGPEHQKLKQWLEGEWTADVSTWMGPGGPTKATGWQKCTTILGGRFVETVYSGNMMGKPFEGKEVMGYDNVAKKYTATWIDTMGTGILTSEGNFDAAGKVLTLTNSYYDAMTGKPGSSRTTYTLDSDKKHTMAMFEKGPDGKEMKTMEIVLTKK